MVPWSKSLFFWCLVLCGSEAIPASPQPTCDAAPDAFAAVPGIRCRLEQMQQQCGAWFAQNPETLAFSRDCDHDEPRGTLDVVKTCASSIGGAWAAGWESLIANVRENKKFYDDCEADGTLACKKQLALEAFFAYRTEAELADVDTMDLVRKRQHVRQMATTDKSYRQQLIAAGVPLPDLAGGLPDVPMNAMIELGKRELDKLQVKLQCYNGEGYAKMVCYAVGSLVDPQTMALGGLGAVARGGRFASLVLRGLKETKEAEAVVSTRRILPGVAGTRTYRSRSGFEIEVTDAHPSTSTDGLAVFLERYGDVLSGEERQSKQVLLSIRRAEESGASEDEVRSAVRRAARSPKFCPK